MCRKLNTVLLTATLFLGFAAISPAQRPMGGRGEFLGTANVDGGIDHDNISVGANQMFRAIQIRVQNAPIAFQRVIVHYGNGQQQAVPLRNRIPAGGSTRWIDLPGERRRIQSVEFWYSRGNWGPRRPKVELYGRS